MTATVTANQRARSYRKVRQANASADHQGIVRTGVGYVRISKIAGRPDQVSDEIQKRAIIGSAIGKGIDPDGIMWFYDYGQSAWENKSPREGFKKALETIRTGKRNTLIAYRVDRIYRNHTAMIDLRDDVHGWGGGLIFASENVDTWDDDNFATRLTFDMHAHLAEQESAIKSERMTDWHVERINDATGSLPPGGPRPFGYTRNRIAAIGRDGTVPSLAINDDEATVIRDAAAMVMDGRGLKGIATELQSNGVKVSRSGLKHILTSETTAGLRFDGTMHHTGNWPAILDRNMWEALCATLSDPQRLTAGPRGERRHMLAGLITCADCGHIMRSRTHTKGPRYGCSGSKCYNSIDAHQADTAIFNHLVANVDADAWRRAKESGTGNQASVIESFKRKLSVITDTYINSTDPDAEQEYHRARADIHARMSAAKESAPVALPDVDDFVAAWPTMDVDARRLVVNAWFESLTLDRYRQGIAPTDRINYTWRLTR